VVNALDALYSWGKYRRYTLDRRLGGPQSWSGYRDYRKKSFSSARDRSTVVQSVVRHYTGYPCIQYRVLKEDKNSFN
jgi:hypothetical protein